MARHWGLQQIGIQADSRGAWVGMRATGGSSGPGCIGDGRPMKSRRGIQ